MSEHDLKFQWYDICSGADLQQGDLLQKFPVTIQPKDLELDLSKEDYGLKHIVVDIDIVNVIVITQSCDFAKFDDTDLVTLCPCSNFIDLYGESKNKTQKMWKSLVSGRLVNAHLLSKCSIDGHEFDYQVVTMSRIFSVPYGFVKSFAQQQGERIRLLPPYREQLSQAFARRFMRVGLPLDLPRDAPY